MTTGIYKGSLRAISIKKNQQEHIQLSPRFTTAFYPVESSITCVISNKSILLNKGDLLVIDNESNDTGQIIIENNMYYQTHIVISTISALNDSL